MKRLLTIVFILSLKLSSGQELMCLVDIVSPKLQLSAADKQALDELKLAIREFVNNTRWTTETFADNEKIECSMTINLSEMTSVEDFGGSIQITSARPVFNSSYKTAVFNFRDEDFKIKYQRNAPMIFSIDQHRSNLTSILAFYVYMIIAYDYDTFSPEGGTKYFNKAQQIVNNAQSAVEPGWKAFEGDRNRYWLVDNALQPVFKPLRQAFYKYHRQGFDMLYNNITEGRKVIMQAIDLIQQVAKQRIASMNVQIFFSTKVDELVELFKGATPEEQQKAYALFKSIDPGNATKYEKIIK
jgi:hypothetical protein